MSDAKSIVEQTYRNINARQKDPSQVSLYFSDDCCFMTPNQPPLMGKNGIREYFTKQMRHMPGGQINFRVGQCIDLDDYIMAQIALVFTETDADRNAGTGKGLALLRKMPNPKIVWCCINAN